jgi:hypothetical protein
LVALRWGVADLGNPVNAAPVDGPRWVGQDEKELRRRAWAVVARAYATSLSPWGMTLLAITLGVPIAVAGTRALGEPMNGTALIAVVAVVAPLTWLASVVFTGWLTSRAPRLAVMRSGTAMAVLALKSDNRRGALLIDDLASGFSAWPKNQGAGERLGRWVVDAEHAAGRRVTGTTWPFLLEAYRRHGMVEDGRTAWFLPRIASRSR